MTAAVPLVERLAEVLAEHVQVSGFDEIGVWHAYGCDCSWTGASDAEHRAHVAQALLPIVEQAVAEARGEAWDEGYLRGTLDTTSDLEPADNPYRADATTEGAP